MKIPKQSAAAVITEAGLPRNQEVMLLTALAQLLEGTVTSSPQSEALLLEISAIGEQGLPDAITIACAIDPSGKADAQSASMSSEKCLSILEKLPEYDASPQVKIIDLPLALGHRGRLICGMKTESVFTEAQKSFLRALAALATSVLNATHHLQSEVSSGTLTSSRRLLHEQLKTKRILENAHDGIWFFDEEAKLSLVNEKLANLLEYAPEEMIGRPLNSFIGKRDSSSPPAKDSNEFCFETKSGKLLYASVNSDLIFDDDETFVGALGMVKDLTAQRQIESERDQSKLALSGEKERVKVTLRSIGDAVVTIDHKGIIVLANTAAETATGFSETAMKGKPYTDFFRIFDKESNKNNAWISQVLQTESPQGLTIDHGTLHVGDKFTDISLTIEPILEKNTPYHGVVLCWRSITEFLEMREDQRRTEHIHSLALLAGGIAHDFNNILTVLVGNLSLASGLVESIPQAHQCLSEAEKACFRAKDLSRRLLTFSKGESPITKTSLMNELIADCLNFFLRGSNSRSHLTSDADLWQVDVDEGQICQVIENLVVNADQAMPTGGELSAICSNFELQEDDHLGRLKAGKYVKVTIADQGTGIPEKHMEKIFDPYFTTKKTGSGLGLATAFNVIRNHEGHIHVTSNAKGTTFTLYLPASEAPRTEKTDTEETPLDMEAARQSHVLVIDDEAAILNLASTTLQMLGCRVETSESTTEGIEKYRKAEEAGDPFDLVILDLTIPGDMGGQEAMQQILKISPNARGIASSGYSEDDILARYENHGFRGILQKPYNVVDLQRTVSDILAS